MRIKPFLRHNKTTDIFGNFRQIYTSLDMKIQIELCTDLNGDYWWTKFKTTVDKGDDEAYNFSREQCLAIAEIYKDIEQRNKKLARKG